MVSSLGSFDEKVAWGQHATKALKVQTPSGFVFASRTASTPSSPICFFRVCAANSMPPPPTMTPTMTALDSLADATAFPSTRQSPSTSGFLIKAARQLQAVTDKLSLKHGRCRSQKPVLLAEGLWDAEAEGRDHQPDHAWSLLLTWTLPLGVRDDGSEGSLAQPFQCGTLHARISRATKNPLGSTPWVSVFEGQCQGSHPSESEERHDQDDLLKLWPYPAIAMGLVSDIGAAMEQSWEKHPVCTGG